MSKVLINSIKAIGVTTLICGSLALPASANPGFTEFGGGQMGGSVMKVNSRPFLQEDNDRGTRTYSSRGRVERGSFTSGADHSRPAWQKTTVASKATPDPLGQLRSEIQSLEQKLDGLRGELATAHEAVADIFDELIRLRKAEQTPYVKAQLEQMYDKKDAAVAESQALYEKVKALKAQLLKKKTEFDQAFAERKTSTESTEVAETTECHTTKTVTKVASAPKLTPQQVRALEMRKQTMTAFGGFWRFLGRHGATNQLVELIPDEPGGLFEVRNEGGKVSINKVQVALDATTGGATIYAENLIAPGTGAAMYTLPVAYGALLVYADAQVRTGALKMLFERGIVPQAVSELMSNKSKVAHFRQSPKGGEGTLVMKRGDGSVTVIHYGPEGTLRAMNLPKSHSLVKLAN